MQGVFGLVMGLSLLLPAAGRASAGDEVTPRELADWLTYFYLQRDLGRTPAILDALIEAEVLTRKAAQAPLTAFFAEVFRLAPQRAPGWVRQAGTGPQARPLVYALWMAGAGGAAREQGQALGLSRRELGGFVLSPPDLRRLPATEPGHVDILWGAFNGSGDTAYLEPITAVLAQGEPADPEARTQWRQLAETAQASLVANMGKHERVRRFVFGRLDQAEGAEAAALAAIVAEFEAGMQPLPTHQGRFSALLGLHRREDFEQIWATLPADVLPRLVTRYRVEPGEAVHVELFVAGMELGPELHARVSYALRLLRPDGTEHTLVETASALDRPVPTAFRAFRAPGGRRLTFGPDDPTGRYVLQAHVVDRIGGTVLLPEAQIDLVPSAWEGP
jgi:hypothetical protein